MDEVILDIRTLCGAGECCVLLTDFEKHSCAVLGESLLPGAHRRAFREFVTDGFVDFAKNWLETLDESNCLIIKNADDFEVIR